MKKLTIVLGILGVFALGCATASVMITQANATPPAGTYQCMSVPIKMLMPRDIEAGKHETNGTWLPAGWVPVGGLPADRIIACRTAL